MSDAEQSAGKDFIQQTGAGNMPVHTGSGDIHYHVNQAPPSPPARPSPPPPPVFIPPVHYMPSPVRRPPLINKVWAWARVNRRWYYLICVLSLGLLAWVPFVLELRRLRNARTTMFLVVFSFAAFGIAIMSVLTPTGQNVQDDDPRSGILGCATMVIIALACICVKIVRDDVPAERVRHEVPIVRRSMDVPQPSVAGDMGLQTVAPTFRPDPVHAPGAYSQHTKPSTAKTALGWVLRTMLWLFTLFFLLTSVATIGITIDGGWAPGSETFGAYACFAAPALPLCAMVIWDVVRMVKRRTKRMPHDTVA